MLELTMRCGARCHHIEKASVMKRVVFVTHTQNMFYSNSFDRRRALTVYSTWLFCTRAICFDSDLQMFQLHDDAKIHILSGLIALAHHNGAHLAGPISTTMTLLAFSANSTEWHLATLSTTWTNSFTSIARWVSFWVTSRTHKDTCRSDTTKIRCHPSPFVLALEVEEIASIHGHRKHHYRGSTHARAPCDVRQNNVGDQFYFPVNTLLIQVHWVISREAHIRWL